jgi:RNA polymerase sigma-70 factor (ECF subfamily)
MNSDKNGIDNLFRCYSDALKSFIAKRLHCEHEAADVVQETFIRLLRVDSKEQGRVEQMQSPKAFIYKIASNLAIDRLRQKQALSKHECSDVEIEDIEDLQPTLFRVVDSEERLRQLLVVVEELPSKCRKVFILHKFKQWSYQEIADKLRISRSMVEKHMMKALKHCDERLGGR